MIDERWAYCIDESVVIALREKILHNLLIQPYQNLTAISFLIYRQFVVYQLSNWSSKFDHWPVRFRVEIISI